MLKIKIKNLDERQLIIRGNIFKHGLFMLVGLLLLNSFLYNMGVDWATGKWAELTIILFTIICCSIEFIYYDIYPLTKSTHKFGILLLGLFGLISIGLCIYEMQVEKIAFIVNGKVTDDGLGIIFGFMFLSIPAAKLIKSFYVNNKNEED